MGTRGLMGFAHDGKLKAMYNHWDSYPSGLGDDIAKWIISLGGDYSEAIEKFQRLEAIDEGVPPTMDQKLALLKYLNLGVSTQSSDDWYSLLRETQGDPQAALDAGYFVDSSGFAQDSLFCEWAYVVDFDREVLEIYRGFQKQPSVGGRFANLDPTSSGYHTIALAREAPFKELQENPSFMKDLQEEIYADDDED